MIGRDGSAAAVLAWAESRGWPCSQDVLERCSSICWDGILGLHAQIVSEAAMRLPEEVYRADGKGAPRAEGELTHEERRRRRAQHKRAFKAKSQQQVWPRSKAPGRRVQNFRLMAIQSVCYSRSWCLSDHNFNKLQIQ